MLSNSALSCSWNSPINSVTQYLDTNVRLQQMTAELTWLLWSNTASISNCWTWQC